jgi:class 3 adenylate cyclase
MEFYEVLAEVIQLLQREGRASYRALKRQFNLDDAYIEDLKEELLFSHPVIDEDGRGLVWNGETDATSESTSQPNPPEPQPIVEQAQSVQETSSPVEPHTPEAERRQLTVMFIDIVESTALSGELDPEDYREVVRQYQQVCSEVVKRYHGHVAQLLGDGLLVYFGFPSAHEDDGQRAVRSGLGIIDAIGNLNTSLEQTKDVKLAVRLGIHTGLVVVGEMGGEGRQEQLALGETPNSASRIQGLAAPDTLVISEATSRLTQGYFDCEPLGEHDLRGVSQPIAVYRVLGDTGIQNRLEVAITRGLTPLVGREQESGLLLERWEQVKDGQGQVILLSGEAGIGKSRLVQVLKDHVAEQPHTRLGCRSSPFFTNSALYPITDFLQRTLRFQTDDIPETKLEKLEHNLSQYRLALEETVPLFASLLSLPVPEDRYPPLNLSPQRQRQKTLESIVAIILELSEQQPLLFILEDLHWTDPTTLEFLGLLIDQTPTASVYVLLTCRPEYQPSWSHRSYLTEMTVSRLSQPQVEWMAQQVAGRKGLTAEIVQQLVDKTDGVPLYVEEMTKAVLESGSLKEVDGHYELTGTAISLTIPATLQDSLMSRLDRLGTAKTVAQYAAVISRQFSYELLQAVLQTDRETVQKELSRLVEAELLYQRGLPPQATYTFKHALIQDTAYQSLLRNAPRVSSPHRRGIGG